MLIEAWLCQKTKGARRPSAVGLTEGSWHRVALSLSLRLLRARGIAVVVAFQRSGPSGSGKRRGRGFEFRCCTQRVG